MPANHEELTLRLERLEHDLQELAMAMSQPPRAQDPTGPADLADRISFRAWMRISAPTFAVMVMGFTLLWNAQLIANEQLMETSRSLGRLDGAIDRLDERMETFDARLESFDQRMESFDARLESFDQRLDQFGGRLDRLDGTIDRLAVAVEKLHEKL